MMGVITDMTGRKCGRLTVLIYVGRSNLKRKNGQCAMWLCMCECGKEKIVAGVLLRSGKTKSCGCLNGEGLRIHHRRLVAFRNAGEKQEIDPDLLIAAEFGI